MYNCIKAGPASTGSVQDRGTGWALSLSCEGPSGDLYATLGPRLAVLQCWLFLLFTGCWVALPCPEDDDDNDSDGQQQQQQQQYYYNTATRSIRWSLPEELQDLLTPPSTTQLDPTAAAAAGGGRWGPHQHQDPCVAAAGSTPSAAAAGRQKRTDSPAAGAAAAAAAAAEAAAGAGVLSPGAYQALIELQEERVMPPLAAITAGTG